MHLFINFKLLKLVSCLLIWLSFSVTGAASDAISKQMLIFDGTPNPNWVAWDCCSGSTPGLVTDDDRGDVYQFEIGESPAVVGFISRSEFLSDDGDVSPFDATCIAESGVLSFDMNVVAPPNNADSFWLIKVESVGAATFAELNLNASIEGVDPEVGLWQTYTFPLADLQAAGLDLTAIDNVMIFPAWGTGDGAVYRVDNVRIYDPTASGGEFNGHVLFKDGALDAWALWDCCGGSTPTVVADDLDHGAVARFEVGSEPTVLGYNSRAEFASEPSQIDASSLLTDGVLQFEMKVVNAPNNADAAWLIKIESDNGVSFIELNLNDSVEGADPVVGQWQTYTFNLSDLSTAGLDVSAIDVVMVFPAWGTGEGAVYLLDNVMIYELGTLPTRKGITIFDNGQTDWAMWDCCGGSTPTVEVDDSSHGIVAEFTVGGTPTVLGFNASPGISANPSVYDAIALLADGYLRFDMKVITPPNNADSVWLIKIESKDAATSVELRLNESVEASGPVVGEWQTYTFNISDLSTAGLDVSAIGNVMVFPAWGTGEGAVYRIDNMVISGTSNDPSNEGSCSNYQYEEPSPIVGLIRDEALALIDENNHATIPDNVMWIYDYAFVNSTIETVSLPANLNQIFAGTFFGTQLTSVEIPNSVQFIGPFAFAYISTLNTIEISNYVTHIHDHAFFNTPLDSVIIGKSVTYIGTLAFSGVTGNVYIKRPADTVVSIDDFPSDVSIFACDEVEETGELENCSPAFEEQLRTVLDHAEVINLLDENGHLSIPENYSSIEYEAFKDIDIQSVVIPEFMTNISQRAFADTSLQTVFLHGALESIGCGTFANTNLRAVIVPTLDVELCMNSFENVNADFYFINSHIDDHGDEDEDDHGDDYHLPWNIDYFSSGATIYICDALLEGVPVDCQQQFIGETKSVLDQYAALNLIDENGHAEIPNFYISIGNSAFSGSQLSSVAIPESIITIEEFAFADSQLESVIIPNSVEILGGYAFKGTPLKSAELGENVCQIAQYAFSNTLLEHIKIPECVTFIGNHAFYSSTIDRIEFGKNLQEIQWSAFSNTALTSVTLPNSLVIIGEAAFQNTLLDSVVIPKSVSAIWINAFNTVSEVWFEPYYEEDSYRTYEFNSDAQILFCELDNDLDNLFDCVDSDDDNDGMPDSYEIANGFDPFNAGDAQVVNSSNGKTSLQEYLSAANPDTNYPWDNIQGTWRIANEENAISFSQDMFNPIWSIVQGGLPTIDCLLDDRIVFKDDGSYIHLFDEATWVPWLGPMEFFDPNSACLGQNNHAVEGVSHVVGTWRIGNSMMDTSTSLTTSSLSVEKPDTYYDFLTINDSRMQLDINNGVWWRLQLDRVADQDFDAVDDNQDNCPIIANMGQLDTDNDSQGDSCDQDDDNDGIDDALEIANGFDPLIANMDIDQDGITNSQDTDHDNDGALNEFDAFPLDATEQLDSDNDGIGDNTDIDKDNDGVMNDMDLFPLDAFESADADGDGIGDNEDLFPNAAEYSQDTDQDLIPDAWENKYGLDPLNPNDANMDQDNDGYTALEEFEAGTIPLRILDIDGDGSFDALSDGLIILRFAFGLRGEALVNGVISNEALRTDPADIEAYLDSLVPSF